MKTNATELQVTPNRSVSIRTQLTPAHNQDRPSSRFRTSSNRTTTSSSRSKQNSYEHKKNLSDISFSSILSCPKCARENNSKNKNKEGDSDFDSDLASECGSSATCDTFNEIKGQDCGKPTTELALGNKSGSPNNEKENCEESCCCELRGGVLWSTCEFCLTSLGVKESRKKRFLLVMEMMYQTGISIGKLI